MHNLSGTSLSNSSQEIICYLRHMKDVLSRLLGYDKGKMQLVDRATVEAVELTAPRASKKDAQKLLGQIQSGEIFGAFNRKIGIRFGTN